MIGLYMTVAANGSRAKNINKARRTRYQTLSMTSLEKRLVIVIVILTQVCILTLS